MANTTANNESHSSGRELTPRQAADVEAIAAIRGGSKDAFNTLAKAHFDGCLRVAFGVLKNKTDSEDAVQDAMTKAFLRLDSLERPAAFKSWLYRIVFNVSIDTYRSQRNRKDLCVAEESARENLNHDLDIWVDDHESNPASILERKQLKATLQEAYDTLSSKHRDVLTLREIEGLSYEEMSEALGVNRGTIMSRLFHARKLLQTKLVRKFKQENASAYLECVIDSPAGMFAT